LKKHKASKLKIIDQTLIIKKANPNSHTHCQAAQSKRTIQSLSKSVAIPTLKNE